MGQDSSRPQPRLSQAKTAGDMVAAMAGEDYRTDGSGENPAAIDPRDLVSLGLIREPCI